MADWVHCNMCFRQPGDGKKFSITNCGHIYCENCVGQGTQPKCRMCGSRCCTTVLSPKMKPDVDIFFSDPIDIVKRQHEQLLKVLDFQRNQRQRLILYTKDKMHKQAAMIQKAQKAMEHLNKLTQENMVLNAENAYLRKNSGGRTPPPSSHSRHVGSARGDRQAQTPSPKSSPFNSKQLAENMYRQMSGSSNLAPGRLTVKTPSHTSPASHKTSGVSPSYSMDCSPGDLGGRLALMQSRINLPITPKTPGGSSMPSPHRSQAAPTVVAPTGMHAPHSHTATVHSGSRPYTPVSQYPAAGVRPSHSSSSVPRQ